MYRVYYTDKSMSLVDDGEVFENVDHIFAIAFAEKGYGYIFLRASEGAREFALMVNAKSTS